MKKNIGCVIVTYFPDNDFLNRLINVSLQSDKIVIVNNGLSKSAFIELSKFASLNENIKVVNCKSNVGIAKALNLGCEYLINIGYSNALLLDQDSHITKNMVSSLEKLLIRKSNSAVVGPQIIPKNISLDLISHKMKYMINTDSFFFKREAVSSKPLKVAFNITSGSLIKLNVWKEIGGFWEDLFIEGVDNEYGLRVNSFGYDIFIDNESFLHQEYGNQRVVKKLGKNYFPTFHSPLRSYYISRNRIMIWKRHWRKHRYYISWDILSSMNMIFQILLLEDKKLEKLKLIIRGYLDGINGVKGKYN
tara:strand:+ start:7817 stop:8731 length:915 start_codon:yes stop_codon:yes gene_type:complete